MAMRIGVTPWADVTADLLSLNKLRPSCAPQQAAKDSQRKNARLRRISEAPRRSMATGFSHYQPEIEGAGMNQQPFDDIFMPAQMSSPHRARLIQMSEAAFDPFSTLP